MTKLKHVKLFESFNTNETLVNSDLRSFVLHTPTDVYYGTVSREDYQAIDSAISELEYRFEESGVDFEQLGLTFRSFSDTHFSMNANGEFEGTGDYPEEYETLYKADGSSSEGERNDELNVIVFEFPSQGVLEYIGGSGVSTISTDYVIGTIEDISPEDF
jgi:hypothetical protein